MKTNDNLKEKLERDNVIHYWNIRSKCTHESGIDTYTHVLHSSLYFFVRKRLIGINRVEGTNRLYAWT